MSVFITWLIGPLFGGVSKWVSRWIDRAEKKQEVLLEIELIKAKITAETMAKKATAEIEWDMTWAQGAKDSWKDEFILIIWAIPFIGAFIPGLQTYVGAGWDFLEHSAPDWYVQIFGLIVAATYGFRKFSSVFDGLLARRGRGAPMPPSKPASSLTK